MPQDAPSDHQEPSGRRNDNAGERREPISERLSFHGQSVENSKRPLAPGHWHRRRFAMAIAASIDRTILEIMNESRELFHRFFVGLPPFFCRGQLSVTQDAGFRVAARPGDNRGRTGRKQIDPVEGILFIVETDRSALDLIVSNVISVEKKVE